MKKSYGIISATLLVFLAVYNVVVFVLPIPKTGGFWTAYIFTTIAILAQLGIDYIAFKNDNKLKSIFLGLPTATVGGVYLFLQLIWGAIVMAVPVISAKVAVVGSVILLGWCLISVIMTSVSRDVIVAVDEKVKAKTNFIKMNQVAVELLIGKTDNPDLKKKLTALRDAIRYSDPMSDVSLNKLEMEIEVRINDLKDAVTGGNVDGSNAIVSKISDLMVERNKLCKALK